MTETAPNLEFTQTSTKSRSNLRATFERDGNSDYIEISIVGDPSVFRGKVKPEHVARFPAEWDAFQKGREDVDIPGTPLMEVPGITKDIARQYMAKGVRNAEELAVLTDMAVSKIGLGALSARKAAKNLLDSKRVAALEEALAAAQNKPQDPPVKRGPGRPKRQSPVPPPAEA